MLGLKDISVNFLTGQPVWVVLGCLVLLGLAGLLYWKTNPPLPRWLRIVLVALRVLAVLALILALAQPVLSYTRHYERKPRATILVDRSASMDRTEDGRTRASRVDSLLNSPAAQPLRERCDLTTRYFGGDLKNRPEEINKNETAVGLALQELDREQLAERADYWLLFSDGNSNTGPRPADIISGLTTPIITVGMAAGGGTADIGLADVSYNAVVFAGQPTEMQTRLRWDGAKPGPVTVQLLDSGRVIAEKSVQIDQESGFADVTLRYVPARPGQALLSVRVGQLTEETDLNNNARTVSVKVLKSRLAILLACENADYEVGFLNRFLTRSDRYDVKLVVMGRQAGNLAGRFPDQQTELNRYDLVILYDPEPSRLDNLHDLLKSYLADRGGGLWVFFGPRFKGVVASTRAAELLPFYPSNRAGLVYAQFHAVPSEGELFHPSVRLADSRSAIRDTWAGLPPFRMLLTCDQVASGSVVLATASEIGSVGLRTPVLGYRRSGPGKVLAVAAAPLWTWGFDPQGYAVGQSPYAKMVEATVNWLTVQDDFDPVRVAPDQTVYRRGEPVKFEGYAFDPGYRPLPEVTGVVAVTGGVGQEPQEVDLIETDAEFDNLPPGQYSYEATLSREGQPLKTSRGQFLVEAFSAEEFNQQGDPATLATIAQATGGGYHHFSEFTQAVEKLNLLPVTETEAKEFVLWGKFWLLAVFIAALALEWGLRKFNHLL
jgi:hypothetical protein